tara:strand:+ start:83 stop:493 length:411 start_codon:yes stop_codon:yes gene_type:complete
MKGYIKKNILIPNEILEKTRKHKNKNEWLTIYYYVDRKRCKAIIDENVCSSKVDLRRNCMYKISNLSKNDNLYNYYRILKPEISEDLRIKEIARLNSLKSRTNENPFNYQKTKKCNWKGKKINNVKIQNKPIIVHF